ncbi:STAS domain-containing protein [Leptolyngbya sp. FACHB-17]|uniref:STAS domain-containing protein n=1 Tax=unclassified Leptolyngbya TaxID=2650499 RepID=UPI0016804EEC|nr:STAS domain-containing protein [Leptolyngbya sp. FACHB-17]MBD2082908.1 STAS domain-containing protein [Leptolyngbya sp. FACHB-17]
MELSTRTIQFPETLDDAAIAQFHEHAELAIRSDAAVVLVDFANVEFMSSPGLMALVIVFKRSREANKPMLLRSINERVRMLLELTGMEEVFEIIESSVEESEPLLTASR